MLALPYWWLSFLLNPSLVDLYQIADDRPSESNVGHENFEFVTTDYDYVVPIAQFYVKAVAESYLSMR